MKPKKKNAADKISIVMADLVQDRNLPTFKYFFILLLTLFPKQLILVCNTQVH